jgi:hypothetical protein
VEYRGPCRLEPNGSNTKAGRELDVELSVIPRIPEAIDIGQLFLKEIETAGNANQRLRVLRIKRTKRPWDLELASDMVVAIGSVAPRTMIFQSHT